MQLKSSLEVMELLVGILLVTKVKDHLNDCHQIVS